MLARRVFVIVVDGFGLGGKMGKDTDMPSVVAERWIR